MHLDLNNFLLWVGGGSGPHAALCCVPSLPPPTVLEGAGGACGPQDLIYILYGPYSCRSCRSLIYVIITGFNLVSLTYRIKLFDNIYMCTVELENYLNSSHPDHFEKLIFCLKCWLTKPTTYKSLYVYYCTVL